MKDIIQRVSFGDDFAERLAEACNDHWSIRRDQVGRPVAIAIDGWDILHLEPTARTIATAQTVVDRLNTKWTSTSQS